MAAAKKKTDKMQKVFPLMSAKDAVKLAAKNYR